MQRNPSEIEAYPDGVSVVIPVFNGSYLSETVQSIADQLFQRSLEVILINDNPESKKNTEEVAQAEQLLKKRNVECRVITQPQNTTQPVARNVGLREAKYRYIFPCDADDILATPNFNAGDKGFIEEAYEIMSKDPSIDAVAPDIVNFGDKTSFHPFAEFDAKDHLERCTLWTPGIYRKSVAMAFGGYDEEYPRYVDYLFWTKMLNYAEENGSVLNVARIHKPYYLYRRYNTEHDLHSSGKKKGHAEGWELLVKRFPKLYKKYFPNLELEQLPDFFAKREAVAQNLCKQIFDDRKRQGEEIMKRRKNF